MSGVEAATRFPITRAYGNEAYSAKRGSSAK
ncbi:MAG: hypothetical protein BWY79_00945 [Actinobacteria bacterium ADurb.Bin444]|nr:MAG: hypothetical protein BWY79_00945 [Actinobacteria bacterium ADurb.Bin444]